MTNILTKVNASDLSPSRQGTTIDAATLTDAAAIIDAVRTQGDKAIREYASRFHERQATEPLVLNAHSLRNALDRISATDRRVLERTHARIKAFAEAQLACLKPLDMSLPGGRAGHTLEPAERVGCYAPGGRYPLPSTVLMTVTPARVAGCNHVVVASPNPPDIVLAAAAIAGADEMIAIGGAHAIAALAYGTRSIDPVDLIVGPGNRWVTAAKKLVQGDVAIDMLAGPSELLVFADDSADAALVAADLLAQAEHDPDARVALITTCPDIAYQVDRALNTQLLALSTKAIARRSLMNGTLVIAQSVAEAISAINQFAPEHLALHCRNAKGLANQVRHAGAIFIGASSAEALGDYGFGPNHTLPTGGAARSTGGLSVLTFIRLRTWLEMDAPDPQWLGDAAHLAALEGLEGHRQSCVLRKATDSVQTTRLT